MSQTKIRKIFEQGGGVFRLIPVFVPRQFSKPGNRLRLHPDDYYAFGMQRGAIKERWLASTIVCNNGPLTLPDEGLSYVSCSQDVNDRFTLKAAVDCLKDSLIGEEYDKHGAWPMYSKFFDYGAPLFHHMHLDFPSAARVGKIGKPEAYYYPVQYNNYPADFPHTFFGFDPSVTKQQVRERLQAYQKGDNRITELSRAFRIELGTGWYTPPGVLHAPGSYLTYEPQWNSDVNSVYENVCSGEVYDSNFLYENCPANNFDDVDYVMSLMDWEKNVDPFYREHYFRPPIAASSGKGYTQTWIVYGNEYIAAKELTIEPSASVTISDDHAYGCILVQGYGRLGGFDVATAGLLRFGQLSQDEYFVSAQAAAKGVTITNQSSTEPLVMLKHFPANSRVPK